MRSAERELLELERKRQVTDPSSSSAAAKLKSANEVAKDRLNDITKQIADESKRLAVARAQLQKAKNPPAAAGEGKGASAAVKSESSSGNIKAYFEAAGAGAAAEGEGAAEGTAAKKVSTYKPQVNAVTEEFYHELCR